MKKKPSVKMHMADLGETQEDIKESLLSLLAVDFIAAKGGKTQDELEALRSDSESLEETLAARWSSTRMMTDMFAGMEYLSETLAKRWTEEGLPSGAVDDIYPIYADNDIGTYIRHGVEVGKVRGTVGQHLAEQLGRRILEITLLGSTFTEEFRVFRSTFKGQMGDKFYAVPNHEIDRYDYREEGIDELVEIFKVPEFEWLDEAMEHARDNAKTVIGAEYDVQALRDGRFLHVATMTNSRTNQADVYDVRLLGRPHEGAKPIGALTVVR